MGWFGDNSSTEHIRSGESHVLLLWFAIPFAIFCVMAFTAPPETGKVVWIYIAYIGAKILYLRNQHSGYINLASVDFKSTRAWRCQRFVNSSETWAQPFSCHWRCQLGLSPSLIWVLDASQHQQLVGSSGLLSWVLSRQPACWLLPELVSEWSQRTLTVQFQCANQWSLEVTTHGSSSFHQLYLLGGFAVRSSSLPYYFKYVCNKQQRSVGKFGLAGTVITLASTAMVPFVARRLGKRNTMLLRMVERLCHNGSLPCGHSDGNVAIILTGIVLYFISYGLTGALIAVMLSDAVDFGEWKNGVRAEGFVTSFSSFPSQVGYRIGEHGIGRRLAAGGYAASADGTQTISIGRHPHGFI